MKALFFWKNWPKTHSWLYIFSLTLLFISLLYFGVNYFLGLDNVIHWDILSELNQATFTLDQLPPNTLTAPLYYVTEQFLASPMALNQTANWGFVILFLIGLILALSAVSTLRSIWYYVGMGLFIFVIASLKIDTFGGLTGNYLSIGLIALYGGISFYFNAFQIETELWKRFLVFALTTAILLIISSFYGNITTHLTAYSLPAALALSMIFVFWIAIEILNGLLYLATSNRNTNGLVHFSVLSIIYLGNVLLIFLQNTKSVNWTVFTFSSFLLYLVSLGLGIWGLKKRAELIEASMPFDSAGAFVYVALGIITTATMGFAFGTANDPLAESLEDTITYTHLTMGLLFFFYIFFNFGPMFRQGLEIHKIAYRPRLFGLYTVRGVAIPLLLLLLVDEHYFPVLQGFAGYYNALGDHQTANNDLKTAEIYYHQALTYEYQNHKSNYALASLALQQGDNTTAGGYFRQALLKQPSAYAYAGLGSCLVKENLFFDAVFALKEGVKKFPKSGELQNNLALLYDKTDLADSAYYFYEQASHHARKSDAAKANVLAFWVKKPELADFKQINITYKENTYPSVQANLLALNNLHKEVIRFTGDSQAWIPKDSALNIMQFACLYNLAMAMPKISTIAPDDHKQATLPLLQLANRPANSDFYSDLLFAQAVQAYYGGDKRTAFDLIASQAAADTTKTGESYRKTLQLWLGKEQKYGDEYALVGSIEIVENLLKAHPFNASLLNQLAQFCRTRQQPKRAYDAIVAALQYRPKDAEILKLYVMQALEINMLSYADEGIMQLMEVMNAPDFQQFENVYETRKSVLKQQQSAF